MKSRAVFLSCALLACEPPSVDRTPTPIDPAGLAALLARQDGTPTLPVADPPVRQWIAPDVITAPNVADPSTPAESAEAAVRARAAMLADAIPPNLFAMRDAWHGYGSSRDNRVVLWREGARFVGLLACDSNRQEGRQPVSVDAAPIDAALAQLRSLSLQPRWYEPRFTHTDDYPMQQIVIAQHNRGVEIVSLSQAPDDAVGPITNYEPWGLSALRQRADRTAPNPIALAPAPIDELRRLLIRLAGLAACDGYAQCAESEHRRFARTHPNSAPRELRCVGFKQIDRRYSGRPGRWVWEGETLFGR